MNYCRLGFFRGILAQFKTDPVRLPHPCVTFFSLAITLLFFLFTGVFPSSTSAYSMFVVPTVHDILRHLYSSTYSYGFLERPDSVTCIGASGCIAPERVVEINN